MKDQPDIVARLRAYTQHNRPVLSSDLKEAADKIDHLRREVDNLLRGPADSRLLSFVQAVSEAAGRKVAPNAFDRADLQHLVDDVAALRRDRDALMPVDLPEDATEAPAVTPSTERFDEIERRLALLESSLRITRRRLVMAGEAMQGGDGMEAAKVMMGFRDAS